MAFNVEKLLTRFEGDDRGFVERVYSKMLSRGLKESSMGRILFELIGFSAFLKTRGKCLKDAEPEDLEDYISYLRLVKNRTRYSIAMAINHIKNVYAYTLKRLEFYEVKTPKAERKKPEVLTVEQVKEMIKMCKNDYERALVAVLYEGGLRVSEAIKLKIKDVVFNKYGAVIFVSGKTGERRIPIIEYSAYLYAFYEHHPFRDNGDAYLFHGHMPRSIYPLPNTHIHPQSVNRILKRLARAAGIKINVHPHLLRHSRATHLAKHLTEQELKLWGGWKSSRTVEIYTHLSLRDLESKLLKIYGLEELEEEKLETKKCPRCGFINTPTAMYCARCALPLTLEAEVRTLSRILNKEEREVYESLEYLMNRIRILERKLEKITK